MSIEWVVATPFLISAMGIGSTYAMYFSQIKSTNEREERDWRRRQQQAVVDWDRRIRDQEIARILSYVDQEISVAAKVYYDHPPEAGLPELTGAGLIRTIGELAGISSQAHVSAIALGVDEQIAPMLSDLSIAMSRLGTESIALRGSEGEARAPHSNNMIQIRHDMVDLAGQIRKELLKLQSLPATTDSGGT